MMRRLYHIPLSPFARKVRLCLAEKMLEFELIVEKVARRRPEFLAMNPAGKVPVLVESDGLVVAESSAICEYLDEVYAAPGLIGSDPIDRAETRRLVAWFDLKLGREVTANLVFEKVIKRLEGLGPPDTTAIRVGRQNIGRHLEYISYLAERRRWLGGDVFGLADIAAAAHLSCLDYLGDVPWAVHPLAKDWYVRIKSRPSFRPLLLDRLPEMMPAAHYDNLDF
jgi:glutathione S-transferase